MSKLSKIAGTIAVAAVVAGGTLAVAAPAEALPPRCNPRWDDCTPITPPPRPPSTTHEVVLASASADSRWSDYHQHTDATLVEVRDNASDAHLRAYLRGVTHTWNDAAFWGFHATVVVKGGPGYFQTSPHTFGVAPTAFGDTYDRTDVWTESVDVSTADTSGEKLYINQTLGG